MRTYLLTATAVIFLSVIVSLLMPEGKLHKTVTFIMRLVCIAVLIQPIKGIFDIGTAADVDNVDYVFLSEVYCKNQSAELEKLLEKEYGVKTECYVEVEFGSDELRADTVTVNVFSENKNLIDGIYAYLQKLGYINITVYAEST